MLPARSTRRRFVMGTTATALGCMLPLAQLTQSVSAQVSPPAAPADLGSYGYPTLDVTVTPNGYEGIPAKLAAGRYLLTVTPSDEIDYPIGVGFVQPNGMSAQAFLAATMGPPAGGTPAAIDSSAGASPSAGEGSGGPLGALVSATFAGGAHSISGDPVQVVLDLAAGEWIAWAFEPEAPQQPLIFSVTGEMPGDAPEPTASATLTMAEYAFTVSAGALQQGSQIIKVENSGAEPHFLDLYKGPDMFTEDQVMTVLQEEAQAGMTGTPPVYSDLNPEEDFTEVFTTTTQSTGVTNWFNIDLEAGRYLALCFFPDAQGVPHAAHGMFAILAVE